MIDVADKLYTSNIEGSVITYTPTKPLTTEKDKKKFMKSVVEDATEKIKYQKGLVGDSDITDSIYEELKFAFGGSPEFQNELNNMFSEYEEELEHKIYRDKHQINGYFAGFGAMSLGLGGLLANLKTYYQTSVASSDFILVNDDFLCEQIFWFTILLAGSLTMLYHKSKSKKTDYLDTIEAFDFDDETD